jgi:hypothetical protein
LEAIHPVFLHCTFNVSVTEIVASTVLADIDIGVVIPVDMEMMHPWGQVMLAVWDIA